MGIAAIQIKIMPDAPDADLDAIEKKAKDIIQAEGGKNPESKIEPVAFGLNAIIMLFAWEEADSTDLLMDKLAEIEHVSSAEITDFRRALG
jgi:translation elongation factor aEF-1 beta